MAVKSSQSLIDKVLGDPSLYPEEMQSWLQRYLSGNSLFTFTQEQLPSVESIREVGTTGNPVFLGAVGNYGSGYQDVGFYKTPEGIIHLVGVAVWDALGNVGFALPVGYRPPSTEMFSVYTNSGAGRIDVDQDGNVTLQAGGVTYVSLSGISYRAA